jgi:hypothetical protein
MATFARKNLLAIKYTTAKAADPLNLYEQRD